GVHRRLVRVLFFVGVAGTGALVRMDGGLYARNGGGKLFAGEHAALGNLVSDGFAGRSQQGGGVLRQHQDLGSRLGLEFDKHRWLLEGVLTIHDGNARAGAMAQCNRAAPPGKGSTGAANLAQGKGKAPKSRYDLGYSCV